MTTRRRPISGGAMVFFAGVAAITAAALNTGPLGATDAATPPDPALQCGVETAQQGPVTSFRPWVQGETDLAGRYRFELAGGGSTIDQSGDFAGVSGARLTLGEAVLSGPPDRYEIRLTITSGGTRYVCHAGAEEI